MYGMHLTNTFESYFLFVCGGAHSVTCMHACVYVSAHTCAGTCGGWKRVSEPLELGI